MYMKLKDFFNFERSKPKATQPRAKNGQYAKKAQAWEKQTVLIKQGNRVIDSYKRPAYTFTAVGGKH